MWQLLFELAVWLETPQGGNAFFLMIAILTIVNTNARFLALVALIYHLILVI